jgi:hypothetical protein
MKIFLHALGAMVVAGLLTLVFMATVNVRSMVWPLLAYAFVTTWILLTIGIEYMTRQASDPHTY